MYKIIVFTHGDLSESLKNTAELITGHTDNVEFYGIPLGVDTGAVLNQISESIGQSEAANINVLVLTDLFFGTPFNLLMTIVGTHKFSHITGVNLPMLLEAISLQDQEDLRFDEVITNLVIMGREAIGDCDKFVQKLLSKKLE